MRAPINKSVKSGKLFPHQLHNLLFSFKTNWVCKQVQVKMLSLLMIKLTLLSKSLKTITMCLKSQFFSILKLILKTIPTGKQIWQLTVKMILKVHFNFHCLKKIVKKCKKISLSVLTRKKKSPWTVKSFNFENLSLI